MEIGSQLFHSKM